MSKESTLVNGIDVTNSTMSSTVNANEPIEAAVLDKKTLQELYDVTEEYGFASVNPATELGEYFHPWTDIANNLQELIESKQLREEVHKMPLLDHNKLTDKSELEAAHMFLAYISQGYVWQEGEDEIPEVLPKCLAIPYHSISECLHLPASFNQFNSVLVNWKLLDPGKAYEPENLSTIVTLAGGSDEEWFFMVALMVEKECGPALYAIPSAQQAVCTKDESQLCLSLGVMEVSILKMVKQLNRMPEGIRPHVFYNVLRRFMSGWNSAAFKNKGLKGLIYEGVSTEPKVFAGGTAAESSTMQALDAALGISHQPSEEELCEGFKKYMPHKHRQFISAIRKGPSIRNYVLHQQNVDLLKAYNDCLKAIQLFRDTHIQIVTRFIILPSRVNSKGQGQVLGTGGTGFMQFLRGLRDSTKEAFIKNDDDEPKKTILPSNWLTFTVAISVTGAVCIALFRKYH